MQTGNPYPIEFCWLSPPLHHDNAYEAEKEIHYQLRKQHHSGEWFKTTLNTAVRRANYVVRRYAEDPPEI